MIRQDLFAAHLSDFEVQIQVVSNDPHRRYKPYE